MAKRPSSSGSGVSRGKYCSSPSLADRVALLGVPVSRSLCAHVQAYLPRRGSAGWAEIEFKFVKISVSDTI